jgi:hypothetical protein
VTPSQQTSLRNGLYCTGVESWVFGRCDAAPVDCDGAISCTTDACEERHRCEHRPTDADGDGDVGCVDDRGDPLGAGCDALAKVRRARLASAVRARLAAENLHELDEALDALRDRGARELGREAEHVR